MKNKNELRIGKVSSVDYDNGMLQIVYGDKDNAVTAKMPYANFNGEYNMPKVGTSVLVAHMSNGSSRGVVIGPVWNKKNTPPESGEGLYRKELSKVPGAAYIRFDESEGEYLVRVPILMLHGVDHTDLEGPEVNIAANIRTSFESPEHEAILQMVHITGLENEDITAQISNNVKITMDLADLEALIKEVKLEILEELELKAKRISVIAERDVKLEDNKFSTTLSEVLDRLEALDKNTSARK